MAGPLNYDRIQETWTGSASGDIALAGAVNNYRAFTTVGASGTTCFYTAFDGTNNKWESGYGTIKSATAIERTTIYSSSQSNNKVNFDAGTKYIFLDTPAAMVSYASHVPGGRLTLDSPNLPVTVNDMVGVSTVYYTPFVHDWIWLWDGSNWTPIQFTEQNLALSSLTSGKNYDVFGYLSGGALALEKLVWTSDTARATDITLTNGKYTKVGDKTRLYLGSFRATGTSSSEDSAAKRFLYNAYNQVPRHMKVVEGTSSWTYSTDSWQQVRATSTNQLDFLIGNIWCKVYARAIGKASISASTASTSTGIGLDSTTANSATDFMSGFANASVGFGQSEATYEAMLGTVGRHTLVWLERSTAATTTWYGANTSFGQIQTGITGWLMM